MSLGWTSDRKTVALLLLVVLDRWGEGCRLDTQLDCEDIALDLKALICSFSTLMTPRLTCAALPGRTHLKGLLLREASAALQ